MQFIIVKPRMSDHTESSIELCIHLVAVIIHFLYGTFVARRPIAIISRWAFNITFIHTILSKIFQKVIDII